jgi:hypothetical protein
MLPILSTASALQMGSLAMASSQHPADELLAMAPAKAMHGLLIPAPFAL